MKQTIQLGQVQPSILSTVESFVKNWRAKFNKSIEQSEFCQVMGITPWHFSLQAVAVSIMLFLMLLVLCGVAEWLEGGAL